MLDDLRIGKVKQLHPELDIATVEIDVANLAKGSANPAFGLADRCSAVPVAPAVVRVLLCGGRLCRRKVVADRWKYAVVGRSDGRSGSSERGDVR
jgi:hypothetical protein